MAGLSLSRSGPRADLFGERLNCRSPHQGSGRHLGRLPTVKSLLRLGVPPLLLLVSGFSLTPNGKDNNRIQLRHMVVDRHVSPRTAADDQLAQVLRCRPADEGVRFRDIDRLDDIADARRRAFEVVLGDVIEDSIEVAADLRSDRDARPC